jgi:hypothetical protein
MTIAERHGARLAQRYGLLLTSLVVLFFVQGAASTDAAWFDVLLTTLAAGTLLLALRAAEARPAAVAVFAAAAPRWCSRSPAWPSRESPRRKRLESRSCS